MTDRRKQIIRGAIITELQRRRRSQYWLAQQIKMHPNEINRALSAGYDMRTSTAEKMMRELGLVIAAEDER